ncbi:MerR family DNA-binding transcriptional regulator [Lachnospiraceae bacterium OttesenSCG-928-D06]|nr:MerR family DNA-binding transcriptional regulator [Lachnospiraceae bacterium OttesenSCG-928-D06]
MKVITIDQDTGKRVYSRKEVATICGVSTQTIRLWEDAKVIPASVRDENDYRYWVEDDLLKIKEYAETPSKLRKKTT